MRSGCLSFNSVSAWRSLPFPNRFCMQLYCPIEANPGPGPQKTVDNFMTTNSSWSRESLIITWRCLARVLLPESLVWGGGSELPSRTHQTRWGPRSYSFTQRMYGILERRSLGRCQGAWHLSSLFVKPFLGARHILCARHILFFQVSILVRQTNSSHFSDEKKLRFGEIRLRGL